MKKPKIITSARKEGSVKQVLILHGWGASSLSFHETKELLKKEGFSVEIPDLPGFNNKPLTKSVMTFGDYVSFVKNLIGKDSVILIGHSFGGRIAIRLAKEYPKLVDKLILTGASGLVHPLTAKQKAASILAATGKRLGLGIFKKSLYRFLGEWDYYTAGPLRETFKNIYRVSIREDLSHIAVPTLLIWGERDRVVPLSDGKEMQARIKNSELIVVPGATHRLPYEMPHVFIEKVLPFLQ